MHKDLLVSDYKKWLLYSFDNQHFNNYYNLFKALESCDSFGSVTILKTSEGSETLYTVSAEGINDDLQITEQERRQFLRYLVEVYFRTDEVDQAMVEKTRESEIVLNHNFVDAKNSSSFGEDQSYQIKPHPKETTYFNIKLAISVLIYGSLAMLLVYWIVTNVAMAISLIVLMPLLLFFFLMRMLVQGIFVGMIRGTSIRITKDQFPEVYNIIEEQAKRLNVTLPEIYISSGHFNAFVTKFTRGHVMLIFSEVIETALKGNYDVLRYVTAHELCHIKQRHLSKRKYLLPSNIIPFLSLAYSRACEFTCDRVGFDFSPKGSIEGILIMTTGKEIHSKFNVDLHIKNSIEIESGWTWLSEKFLTHPHLYKRLIEIKKYSAYS
jgi:Zn-dependent protease with chaperone function